jgi:hypothetical protein
MNSVHPVCDVSVAKTSKFWAMRCINCVCWSSVNSSVLTLHWSSFARLIWSSVGVSRWMFVAVLLTNGCLSVTFCSLFSSVHCLICVSFAIESYISILLFFGIEITQSVGLPIRYTVVFPVLLIKQWHPMSCRWRKNVGAGLAIALNSCPRFVGNVICMLLSEYGGIDTFCTVRIYIGTGTEMWFICTNETPCLSVSSELRLQLVQIVSPK